MKNKIKSTLSSFLISSLMLNPQISKGDSLEEKLTKNKDQTELPKEFIEKSSKNQIFLSKLINDEQENPIANYVTDQGKLNTTFFVTDTALYQTWSPKRINLEENQKFILRESPISNNQINFSASKLYLDGSLSKKDIDKYATKRGILQKTNDEIKHSFQYEKIGYDSAKQDKEKYEKFLNNPRIKASMKKTLIDISNTVGKIYRDSIIEKDNYDGRKRFFNIINGLYNSYSVNETEKEQIKEQIKNQYGNLDSLISSLPTQIHKEPKIELEMIPHSNKIDITKDKKFEEKPTY
ncbi:MAG: hypothetical protein PF542_04060, partial [Nanoarchaeota archaeon]|nr:hypothetical protein [Nanoarchaeota archaeon]